MINDLARRRQFRVATPGLRPWMRVVVAIAVALALLVLIAHAASGGGSQPSPSYRVTGGDTLWSIAESHYAPGDVRSRIEQIITLNNLASGELTPGEMLILPQ